MKPDSPTRSDASLSRQAESNLPESESIFRLLVDAVEDYAIFALDPNGFIQTWNAGGVRLKGYTANEVIGTHFSRFYTQPDIDRKHPAFELKQAAAVGKYEEEGWRLRKDGTTFWANVVITALRDARGVLQGFGKVTRDLSNRKRAEEALKESEERFRLMIESVHDYAIFMLDPQGIVVTWNKGAERNKGYTAAEIIGEHFSRFYPPGGDAEKPARELAEAEQTGRFEEEGWRVRKDGSRFWANVVLTPIYDKSKALIGFAKVTRNLSERKQAEDDLRLANANLEIKVEHRTRELLAAKVNAEQAVKARDQFFSMASHELKTPLSSLKMQTQIRKRLIARGDFSDFAPDRIGEVCDDDERQIDRLTFLVENMLDISRLTSGTFRLSVEQLTLNELLQDVIRRMTPILDDAGVTVTFDAPTAVSGTWDRHRLEQVFTNLLSNAARYAPGKPVTVTLMEQAGQAFVAVSDQGPGISIEHQERIFDAFERVTYDHDAGGMGLGLFIVKQIVANHGGDIRLESKLGSGTTFVVALPLDHAKP